MTALEQHLDEYLQLRRSLGHKLADAHRLLPRFVTYLDEHDIEFVTIESALGWSLERVVPDGSRVPAQRMMAVRGFARYLSGIDLRTEIPPAGTIRRPNRWRRPFIYTDGDVLALIEQAKALIPQPLRSATYQTLIGLLATSDLTAATWTAAKECCGYAPRSSGSRGWCRCRTVPLLRSSATATPVSGSARSPVPTASSCRYAGPG